MVNGDVIESPLKLLKLKFVLNKGQWNLLCS